MHPLENLYDSDSLYVYLCFCNQHFPLANGSLHSDLANFFFPLFSSSNFIWKRKSRWTVTTTTSMLTTGTKQLSFVVGVSKSTAIKRRWTMWARTIHAISRTGEGHQIKIIARSILYAVNVHLMAASLLQGIVKFLIRIFHFWNQGYNEGTLTCGFWPVWPNWLKFLKNFGNFSKALFGIWQYFEPILSKNCYWAKFHWYK